VCLFKELKELRLLKHREVLRRQKEPWRVMGSYNPIAEFSYIKGNKDNPHNPGLPYLLLHTTTVSA
jgi:hypothetical protein